MGPRHRATAVAALVLLPLSLFGCGAGADKEDAPLGRAPAEEAATKSRERVQAYLDAMSAKDVDAGRSQLCAPMHAAFDAAATGPNGDFADHFEVPKAAITDIRTGPAGQEVSAVVTVAVGAKEADRRLLFTVTRSGADWCISGETAGGAATETPVTP
ncbi:hypothetical protein [Micromonospora sp. KC213]|uniref:hypothetical protein n=1 Tax=Micromonospora sp. KC213 TaxID=2530378 RepID=UPI00104CE0EB|nr:hypothetical protein [Micromonospora sp. KC213]TDC37147.1 hypothetical protein E1166_20835 [Micromonospora sp. KC213]